VQLEGLGYLVLGRADYLDGRSRAWLGRVSREGTVVWEKEGAFPGDSSLVRGVYAGAGAAYVVGHIISERGASTAPRQMALVARVEADGTIAWMRRLSAGRDTRADAVTVSKDGTIMVAGTVRDTPLDRLVFIARLTPAGEVLWQRSVTRGPDFEVSSVHELRRGGYLVTGSFGLVRVDAEGAQTWDRSIDDVYQAAEMEDGTLMVAAAPAEPSRRGVTLMKLTERREVAWTRTVGGESACGLLAGLWISREGQVVVASGLCESSAQLWVAEVSASGERGPLRRLAVREGASAYEVQPDADGSIVAAGMFTEDAVNRGMGWLFKSGPLAIGLGLVRF
jgi:hypothetical protein